MVQSNGFYVLILLAVSYHLVFILFYYLLLFKSFFLGTYHHFDKKYKTSKIISVNVKLMDDKTDDSLAWQKLQLFRESLDDNHEPSLIIDIKLKDDKDQKSS